MVLFMKSSEDYKSSIYEKADKAALKKANRKRMLISVSTVTICVTLVIFAAAFFPDSAKSPLIPENSTQSITENPSIINPTDGNKASNATSSSNVNADTTQSQNIPQQSENNNTLPNLSLPSLSQWQQDANVVWGSGSALKGNNSTGISVDLGKILITPELKSSFASGKKNTIYAVMVDFSPMAKKDILIEGKAIAEWNNEVKALAAQGKNTEAKAIKGCI